MNFTAFGRGTQTTVPLKRRFDPIPPIKPNEIVPAGDGSGNGNGAANGDSDIVSKRLSGDDAANGHVANGVYQLNGNGHTSLNGNREPNGNGRVNGNGNGN